MANPLWQNRVRQDPLLEDLENQRQVVNLVDPSAELSDPNPNLNELFQLFDLQFFDGKLGSCLVEWSTRMISCAGICYYKPNEGLCIIRMSEKLLKLRRRRDLVESLLHEMIHAYLFVTKRFSVRDGHDGHGKNFQAHMRRINRLAGTNVTIYHMFNAEVAHYQQKKKRVAVKGKENKRPVSAPKRTFNGPARTLTEPASKRTFSGPARTLTESASKRTFTGSDISISINDINSIDMSKYEIVDYYWT